jgi:hypothetical protein
MKKKSPKYQMTLTSPQAPWSYFAFIIDDNLEKARAGVEDIAKWWGIQSGSRTVLCEMKTEDGLLACDPFEVTITRPAPTRPVTLFISTKREFYGVLEALDQYVERWEFGTDDCDSELSPENDARAKKRVRAVAKFRDAFYEEFRRLEKGQTA